MIWYSIAPLLTAATSSGINILNNQNNAALRRKGYKKMAKFTVTAKIVIRCNFMADNPDHAKKIASTSIWNAFDEIDVQSDGDIEISEIDTIMSVEDFEE
jgi:hypothetical protein